MEFLKGLNAVWFMAVVLAGGVLLEQIFPWRRSMRFDLPRWARAGLLNYFSIVLLGLLPFISGYGLAVFAEARGAGLLNVVAIPFWAELAVTLVVADLVAFGQHWMLHRWRLLWRLHRAHHSDVKVDASTTLRFHPLETLFRAGVEAPFVILFGLPPEGMLFIFGVFLIANLYTHFNVGLPPALERAIAPVFVTPSMHRLHHTTDDAHQRVNYGTIFSIWDRLIGTRRGPDALGEDAQFGLEAREALPRESFAQILLDPFRKFAAAARPDR